MAISGILKPRSKLDNRVTLAVFGSYTVWLVAPPLGDFATLGVVAGAMVLLLAITSRRRALLFRRLINAVPAALIVVVFYWIFAPGEPSSWFTLLGINFGPRGLTTGSFFAARFLAFLLGGFFLYETSAPERLARALAWLLTPLQRIRIPIRMLYYVVWFALRTIPVLAKEAQVIRLAQRARGAHFSGPPRQRLTAYLSLIGPVFAAGARRSDRFALALEARGFDPEAQYRFHQPRPLRGSELIWLTGLAGLWILFFLHRLATS